MAERTMPVVLLVLFLSLSPNVPRSILLAQSGPDADQKIWSDFVLLLKDGKLGEDHLRPAYTDPATMARFLESMRSSASWPEWERTPEVHRVGPLIHFVIPLSENGTPNTYSFTFVTDGERWFLQHFESIVVRLDRVGPLPTSLFPDLAEDKKAWMREENYWSQMIVLFRLMRAAAGPDAAFNMFRDGPGYLVQAKTWVPLVTPARAFVLFSCWEQSRLHGNGVTLEQLTDNEARVSITSIYFRLYRQTGHLRQQITEDDYRRIFETIWRDRATAAGWNVQFAYDGTRCTLQLTKMPREDARPDGRWPTGAS
jgi:hypothetical protein